MLGFETVSMPVLTTLVAMTTCPSPPPPELHVWQSMGKTKYEFSKSSEELGKFDLDTLPPFAPDSVVHVSGLTATQIAVTADINFQTALNPADNTLCVWPKKIDVKLKMDPTVYVASELYSGSCRHAAVMKHERKHVEEDDRLGKELLPVLKQVVAQAASDAPVSGPAPEADLGIMKKRMIANIDVAVDGLLQKFYKRRTRHQQAIDTLDEYRRVKAGCPGKWYE